LALREIRPSPGRANAEPVSRWEITGVVLVCALLVAYDATRCRTMSLTHDEALTYAWHVTGSVYDIVWFNTPGIPANNHLLFTLFAKLSVLLFGDSEVALRLPSILAYALFCAAVAAIIFRQLRGLLGLLCLIFVVLNPYIVDMMSIARGYGLGLALSMAGTWCLLHDGEAAQPRPARWAGWAAVCFGLAVLANLTFLLIFAVALCLTVFVRLDGWWHGRTTPGRAIASMIVPLLVSAALAPLLIRQIPLVGQNGDLQVGGATSFLADTIGSLLNGTLYFTDYGHTGYILLVIFAYAVPIFALAAGIIDWSRSANSVNLPRVNRDLLIIVVLLVGTALLSVLQHHLRGVAYLSGRRAIFLYPLWGIACSGLLAATQRWPVRRRWIAGPALVMAELVMVAHFVLAANLRMTLDWRYDSQTKAMMRDLEALLPRDGPPRYRLGVTWLFAPSINYYLRRNGWTSVAPVTRDGPLGPYDAYYVVDGDLPALRATVAGVTNLRHYETASATLARAR
jgi:4-amino-4-deoxy-L-arabinose transferase-like glycosyltransferase